jgi:AcrR family transcriptional regulator
MTKSKESKAKIQLKAPTQERSRQTVATILEACAQLLVKESFYEITTDKVAKEAGVSIGSLYQFFGNKESVVLALIKKIHDEDKITISDRIKSLNTLPADQRVRGVIETTLEVMTSKPELRNKLQSIQNYLIDAHYMTELNSYYVHLLKQALPQIPGRDMDKVSYLLVNVCFGVISTICLEKPNFIQDKALVNEIMLLVYKYLDLDKGPSAVSAKSDQLKVY